MCSSVIYFGQCSKGSFTSSHFKLSIVGIMAAVTVLACVKVLQNPSF